MVLSNFIKANFRINAKRYFNNKLRVMVIFFTIFIKHVLFILNWYFFCNYYKKINQWGFQEILLMYGNMNIALGILETFFYGLKELPRDIYNNNLDILIAQPKSLLLKIAISKTDFSALSEIVTGAIFLYLSGYLIKINIFILLTIWVLSTLLFSAIYLIISSLAFFIPNAEDFIHELRLNVLIIAGNPNSAYTGLFKFITYFIIPVAFVSYFPIEFLRTQAWLLFLFTIIGTVITSMIALLIFSQGLKRYNSSSLFSLRN